MALWELAGRFLERVPVDAVMAHVARIAAYDRYQASRGIEDAAAYVAEVASASGLREVSLDRFPATGATSWWSFRAPASWTPLVARIEIRTSDGRALTIDHERQPFSIATYSSETPRGGVTARLVRADAPDLAGAVAIAGRAELAQSDFAARLVSRGALGFIAAPSTTDEPARIELDTGSPLFAFSMTARQLASIGEGATASVWIQISRSASMPVVSGVLPGERPGEVWLLAHLCHPRPGANDNASGVAALLGVAATLARSTGRAIRFISGPEYLGTTAVLHSRVGDPPYAVINLDMVGEDQARCASPFIVERNPDWHASLINPLAEEIVRAAFARTSQHGGTWQPRAFHGFSDHALFASDASCAAVQFCHPEDRFNHSAADTLDKVSSIEMLRTITAAATLAHVMSEDDALSPAETERIVADWCAAETALVTRVATVHGGHWGERLLQHVARTNEAMTALARGEEVRFATREEGRAVTRNWDGPMNVRAMLADAPAAIRRTASDLIRAAKRNYALLLHFALRADCHKTRATIIDDTSFSLRQPIDEAVAESLFEALLQSGWLVEGQEREMESV